MDLLIKCVVFAIVLAVGWSVLQPRYVFLVKIADGAPRLSKGKVTSAFLSELDDACARHGVVRGWVGGVHRGRLVALTFSRNLPNECRQQLRNTWMFHH
jgi:hypothetical protein